MKIWVKLTFGVAAILLVGAAVFIFESQHVTVNVVATNFPGGTIELERSSVKNIPVGNSDTWQIFKLHGDSSLVIKCFSFSGTEQHSVGYFTNGLITNARVEIEGCKIKSVKYFH